MKKYQNYLEGNEFSEDLSVEINNNKKIIEKLEFIGNLIQDKKIVDVGFADHIELIEARVSNNNWVHKIFREKASKAIGIDVYPDAIEQIKKIYNYTDIYCHDITSDNRLDVITKDKWDYLILSEVLEHISDPTTFLKSIRTNYSSNVDKVIISVPNAFGLITLKSAWKGIERINSDHRFWFTPYTLSKVLTDAGYIIEEIQLCNSYFPLTIVERLLVKKSQLFNHTLVIVASL